MLQRIVNLTPHAINVEVDEQRIEFQPSGTVARVTSQSQQIGTLNGIPVNKTVFGEIQGLPEPEDGVFYIVSGMVAGRVPDRGDVLSPDTGPTAIRNEKGQVVAVRGFQKA